MGRGLEVSYPTHTVFMYFREFLGFLASDFDHFLMFFRVVWAGFGVYNPRETSRQALRMRITLGIGLGSRDI